MVNGAPCLHDLDDCCFDLVPSEVFDLLLHAYTLLVLGLLAYHYWDLVSEQRALVVNIDGEDIFI